MKTQRHCLRPNGFIYYCISGEQKRIGGRGLCPGATPKAGRACHTCFLLVVKRTILSPLPRGMFILRRIVLKNYETRCKFILTSLKKAIMYQVFIFLFPIPMILEVAFCLTKNAFYSSRFQIWTMLINEWNVNLSLILNEM